MVKNLVWLYCENQARQLISENSKTSPNVGGGVGDEEWSGVALPLVRRVFGNIVAQELSFCSTDEFTIWPCILS